VKGSKQIKDHIIINCKQAAQEKISIFLPSHIINNLRPWDFRHPSSNITWRPTPDPKLVTPSLLNHPTQLCHKNCVRFLRAATKLLHPITDEFARLGHWELNVLPSSPSELSYNFAEQLQQ
jgi:hypothetical protein